MVGKLPPPRCAALRHFRDVAGEALDQGLVLVFPAPNSFTGEDVVELQGHGGPAVLSALLHVACAHGARPARPGEFSERAFLNGRLDLAQAEAVADLIDAGSAQAARAAQRSLDGEFSRRVHALLDELTQLRVFIEGALDFSDEDINWLADDGLRTRLEILIAHLRDLLAQAAQGRRLREGLIVAIAGQPNVGKSTLLNKLAGVDAAIVTEIAGTTRDVLREDIVLDGLPLTVVDTAGLRDTRDPVEREGIRRAWRAFEQAEVILFLLDDRSGLTRADEELLQRLPCGPEIVLIENKCDLSGRQPCREERGGRVSLRLAAHTGGGLELLVAEIKRIAGLTERTENLFSARTRHVEALQRALAYAHDAQRRLHEGANPELAAEELRVAQQALSEITGAFTSDDLLGKIFSQFCIGK
jgi:tRNA modification GTPase